MSMASVPGSRLNLLCLPYAGGGAAIYREWPAAMPSWVQVVPLHLAGRGARHADAPLHDWSALIDDLVGQARGHVTQPFAIFGHSMGGIVGLELAHALRARHGVSPLWLGASASLAPPLRKHETHWLTCDDDTFLAEVRRLGGMPESLLGNREFMELVMPALRADFHLCGTYDPPVRTPLDCPVFAINGDEDARCVVPENEPAWARETNGPFASTRLPAGHFFINTHRTALVEHVLAQLCSTLAASQGRIRALA